MRRPRVAKSDPRATKMPPRQVWKSPTPLQKRARRAPREILGTTVVGSLVPKAAGAIFHNFACCSHCLRSVFRTNEIVVFLHSEHSASLSAHACTNVEKSMPGGSKTFPGAFRDRSKSSVERARTLKKRPRDTTNATRGEKHVQDVPKSETCANMVRTCGVFDSI